MLDCFIPSVLSSGSVHFHESNCHSKAVMLRFFIQHLYPCPHPSLTASSLGTKSRCPIPRRPITLQKESSEAWLLWAVSSAFPSPSSTALRTAGRGRCGVRFGKGGGEDGDDCGGDGGGVGQGEGEGGSRSGARVEDDSSVSSNGLDKDF